MLLVVLVGVGFVVVGCSSFGVGDGVVGDNTNGDDTVIFCSPQLQRHR